MFDYAKRLKELRENKNISARKLAQGLNITPAQISRIENKINNPSILLIDSICTFFNITHAEFFKNDNVFSSASTEEELELLSHFRHLNEKDQWRLIERAAMMCEEQEKKKTK